MKTTQSLPLQERKATLTSNSVNAEARTAELIWSTGAEVLRQDWWTGTRYIERLSLKPGAVRLDRMNDHAPLLNTHGMSFFSANPLEDVLGVVVPDSTKITTGSARSTVRFSKRESVEPIFQDVQDGIIRNVSVGYRVFKFEVTEANEKTKTIEIREAVDWEPGEISLVPMGADPKAHVRTADGVATEDGVLTYRTAELGTVLNECELETREQEESPSIYEGHRNASFYLRVEWGEDSPARFYRMSDGQEVEMVPVDERRTAAEESEPTPNTESEEEAPTEVLHTRPKGLSSADRKRRLAVQELAV